MLLLGGILLAVFVVPWPWGVVTVAVGGLLDIGESFAFVKWSRRRRSTVGVETLVGQTAVVATRTQVRVAGELWAARSDEPLRAGDEVEVAAVDGLTLEVSRRSPARH
jgi:membrane protein implicated in regulation of membrane protease activity